MSIREVIKNFNECWRIEPSPTWATPWEPDWEFEAPEGSAVALLLVDEQQHVASQSLSNRIVRRLLSPTAIHNFGQAEISFDAETHRLRIHDLVVWRNDHRGDRQAHSLLGAVGFEARPQERQAGWVSVVARLDGLQEGDAVDLSWTLVPLRSRPELPFTTFHAFVWNVPCGASHFTIHSDPGVPVKSQLHCPESIGRPEQDSEPGRQHWGQRRPPITRFEPNAPPGVWNFPVLEASCWRDWNEVAETTHESWAAALFEPSVEISDAIADLQTGRDQAASITEAIRFVQDEIVDMVASSGGGVELSPNAAGTVLQRGSGDAKDKAVLLTAFLRQLGVEACPLLVNPNWQDRLASLLPSPAVFNHVIVTFLVDGQRYFVDPSDASQKRSFSDWVQPSYGVGLEVKPGVTALISLPSPPQAELTLTETFHLDRTGKRGSIDQVLRATNWLADEVRESIQRDGKASFIKAHTEALQHQFPALSPHDESVDLREDPRTDAIEMHGRYDLPTWGKPGERPPAKFGYRAHGLFLAVDWSEQPEERTIARALRHPMRVEHLVRVDAKFLRPGKAEQRSHTGPGFRYRCDVTRKQGQVIFDHVWESTASQVEASEWPDYCQGVNHVFELVESSVPTQPSWTSFANGKTAVFASLVAVGVVGALGAISHLTGLGPWQDKDDTPPQQFAQADKPQNSQPPAQPPPPEVKAEVQMALKAATQGDLTSAQTVLEKQQDHFKEDPAFQFVRAEVAIRTGQLDRAREALEQAKALDPSNANGEILTAVLQRAEGDPSGAKQVLASAVERNPNDPRPLRELAITLAQQGNPKGAGDAWARVLELTPGDTDALRQYAVLLWQSGEKERADAMIQKALAAQSPPSVALEAAAGDYYTLTGRRAEAMNRLEKAASLAPGDRTRDFELASGQIRMGRTTEAAELATKLTRDYPLDVRGWQVLAVAKSILGDQAGAEAAYQEWLRLAPNDPDGPANFGFFLHQAGRNAEARDFLAKCTTQFPKQGVIWLNYSVALEALGEKEPAAAAMQKANELLTPEEKQLLVR